MQKRAAADVVIFGGGIAGLWLLNRLRHLGFSVILFESGALGGGQTHKSQGIIHGGVKYALQGLLTNDARAMIDMPTIWKKCLKGEGEIDLSSVPVLSSCQYLWSPNKLTAKLAGFLASTTLNSAIKSLPKDEYPTVFHHADFKGQVFSLDELVLDVPLLVRELVKANQDAIYHIEPLCDEELKFDANGVLQSASVYLSGKSIEVTASQFIFTAGSGNDVIINKLKNDHLKNIEDNEIAMQRRPLHMVMAKLPFHYPLYGHCLGLDPRPRITITTHMLHDGSMIWYLGGLLAEDGVQRSTEQQISAAREELSHLFPWLDFTSAEFATFMVDRAEPLQKNGLKPEGAWFKAIQNMIIAWPTKLALAPKLAQDVITHLQSLSFTPNLFDTVSLRSWPIPPLARPIWEEHFAETLHK